MTRTPIQTEYDKEKHEKMNTTECQCVFQYYHTDHRLEPVVCYVLYTIVLRCAVFFFNT